MEPKSLIQIISEQEFLKIIKEPFELFFTISNDFEKIVEQSKVVVDTRNACGEIKSNKIIKA